MNNRVINLDFRREDFGLFTVPQETALDGRGVQEIWLIFRTASSKHKNGPFPCAKVKQAWQEASMDERGACKGSTQEVEAGRGYVGGI